MAFQAETTQAMFQAETTQATFQVETTQATFQAETTQATFQAETTQATWHFRLRLHRLDSAECQQLQYSRAACAQAPLKVHAQCAQGMCSWNSSCHSDHYHHQN